MQDAKHANIQEGEMESLIWTDLAPSMQMAIGLLNALASFCFVLTLGWDHKMWYVALIVPLCVCLASSICMVNLVQRMAWQGAAALSAIAGLILLAFGWYLMPDFTLLYVITLFGILGSLILCLNYIWRIDVGDAAAFNLRIFSALVLFSILLYMYLLSAMELELQLYSVVLYIFVTSLILIISQLAIARRIQAQSSQLKQSNLHLVGSGILTIAAIFIAIGPLATVLLLLFAGIVMGFIFLPLFMPIANLVYHILDSLNTSHRAPLQLGKKHALTNHANPPYTQPHMAVNWILWVVIVAVLFIVMFIFILRSKKKYSEIEVQEVVEMGGTVIVRDKQIDSFQLLDTKDPVRRRYQLRLKRWHDHGFTLGKAESSRELLNRISSDEKQHEDESLTQAYETARYGQPPDQA